MSLTLAEARTRAATLSDVAYDLALDLRDPAQGGTFGTRTTVTFAATTDSTFLELTAATDLTVTLNGTPVEPAYDGRRITLTGLAGRNEVTVSARMPYVTDGDGMHFFTDPADGETYVSAYLGIDVTQRVFPCFDQVDLKAPLTLAVEADPRWTVLANGVGTGVDGSWTFTTTPPIPIDNMVVCAGPWHSHTWEHAGLPFGWHARRSLSAELDRDIADLRAVTEACFDHYAEMIDEPYPFDCFDQAMVPGQNWGAQEMPGCIVYRDEYLPRGRVTAQLATGRATVIAHEMAHMWFGNLVTMRWWEDTWLNESFADYMGYRVAGDAAGYPGALVEHEAWRKPGAYDADVRRSTHPVATLAEDVPDVDTAFNNFDAISYAKGNSVLRQLVTWMGDEDFLTGVNVHLTRHAWGNADLADFVEALDSVSSRDVRGWVEVWLQQSGHDTIRVTRDGSVPVLHRDGVRPHRLRVTAYDGSWTEVASTFVDLADEPVRLEAMAGLTVVPNAHGETFAALRLDPESWSAVLGGLSSVADDLVRTVLWQTAGEQVQAGQIEPSSYAQLLADHLAAERHPTLVAAVLARNETNLARRVGAEQVAGIHDAVAAACDAGLAATDDEQLAVAFARGVAATSRDADRLRGWLAADRVGAWELDPGLRWTALTRLAELGVATDDEIEAERRRDGTYAGDLGAARARAARPTPDAKAEAWAAMTDEQVSNRMFEAVAAGLWSPERPDLVAPYVERYVAEGPLLAERRGQAFSQVVGRAFPTVHLTDPQLDLLRAALAGDVPTVLRRHWDDALDDRS
ncbi:MAG: Membrane alanyl aminopeptidase Metallo peptidase family [Nocardioidaceae bacterium]|nr:Membrane alanyl aminopeptidase Metallo peptidase family [Nocardioidaceae bacterium]